MGILVFLSQGRKQAQKHEGICPRLHSSRAQRRAEARPAGLWSLRRAQLWAVHPTSRVAPDSQAVIGASILQRAPSEWLGLGTGE